MLNSCQVTTFIHPPILFNIYDKKLKRQSLQILITKFMGSSLAIYRLLRMRWNITYSCFKLICKFDTQTDLPTQRRTIYSSHQFFGEVTNQITISNHQFFCFKSQKCAVYFSCDVSGPQLQPYYTAHFDHLKRKNKWFEIGDFTKKLVTRMDGVPNKVIMRDCC